MKLNSHADIPHIVANDGYRVAGKRLGLSRGAVFDRIHKVPANLLRYRKLQAALKDAASGKLKSRVFNISSDFEVMKHVAAPMIGGAARPLSKGDKFAAPIPDGRHVLVL